MRRDREIPVIQRLADRPGLAVLFSDVSERQGRDRQIHVAYVKWGYTMKAIAEFLRLHYATISRALNKTKKMS